MIYCNNCLNQHKPQMCENCLENPKYRHLGLYYSPWLEMCPIKEWGCKDDPGYLKYYRPGDYEELFGKERPADAINHKNSKCSECPLRKEKETK